MKLTAILHSLGVKTIRFTTREPDPSSGPRESQAAAGSETGADEKGSAANRPIPILQH
jgi:hypothetical protein